ncbi:MAG: N4-gp56 family major capsid protein [Thermodesulfobacteriota bacterium]|nr:N4-gp56 family major capsid protein [Thermodesulfobacteriota bacterium]
MNTDFGTNSAQNVNIWSKLTFREVLKATNFRKYLGKSKRSIIQRVLDLEKTAGDTMKYDLLMQMVGAGVKGDNRMRDNEEPLVYEQDSLKIDQLRNAHSFRRMSQQRTLHSLRTDGKENLADWFSGILNAYMFRYLGGDTTINHAQSGVAPDSDHYIVSGDVSHTGTIATDESNLSDNDQIDLMDLDYAKEKAMTISPPIRPTIVDGKEYYVANLHTYSIVDLRTSANNSATVKWPTIQADANMRGSKNPIFTGAHGVYNGIIIDESTYTYSPISNVRRNLFLGSQAGVFGIGNAYDKIGQRKSGSENLMSWYEDTDDYGNEKGIAVGMIFGMKACRFDSKNNGCMVITSYAAAHG